MTPRGTPGLCLATTSAFASIIAPISVRICLIRSSSAGATFDDASFNLMFDAMFSAVLLERR